MFANHKKRIDPTYKRRIQTLFLNLKDKKNPGLRKRVIQGDVSTTRLATMESHEMASEERKKEDEALRAENLRNSMTAKSQRSISDQLQCGKCGQKKVSYTQAQTRSADEPMTTVSCIPPAPTQTKKLTHNSFAPANTAEICGSSHSSAWAGVRQSANNPSQYKTIPGSSKIIEASDNVYVP